jgi:CO/xanthine dehydrogenase Mo-binding subunit
MTHVATDAGRRDFLKVSALAGGGLVLAISLPGCGRKKPAGPAAGGMPNAWLRIGGDNRITVLVDRSEMGQGVYTALPMLLAEELEVPLAAIAVEAAPPGAEYVNAMIGVQITGGSTSVRDAWQRLRQAGATARVMLTQAAAAEWGVDPGECRVEGGSVRNADGDALTYGEVAEAASKLPVPKDVELKAPERFTLIGTRAKRTDTPGKVDGSAVRARRAPARHALCVAAAVPRARRHDQNVMRRPPRRCPACAGDDRQWCAVVADHLAGATGARYAEGRVGAVPMRLDSRQVAATCAAPPSVCGAHRGDAARQRRGECRATS